MPDRPSDTPPRMYTWDRAGASRRHGHWHDVMRDRAREILAVATPGVLR